MPHFLVHQYELPPVTSGSAALGEALPLPLLQGDPLSIWRSVAIISVVLNVLLLYLLVLR